MKNILKYKFQKNWIRNILAIVLFSMLISNSWANDSISYNYIQRIIDLKPTWIKTFTREVNGLFFVFWFAESAWQFVSKKMWEVGDIKILLKFIIIRLSVSIFFFALFYFPEFYLAITKIFIEPGISFLNSVSGDATSPVGELGLNPGWIFHQYQQWVDNDYLKAIKDMGGALGTSNLGEQFSCVFARIIYFLSCVYISFQIILMDIELVVIIYGAWILAGFFGSSWTRDLWKDYIKMCIGMGLKILIFCLLYGVMLQMLQYKAGQSYNSSSDIWLMIVNTILATLILGIIPGRIAGAVSSVANGSSASDVAAGFMAGVSTANLVKSVAGNTVAGAKNIGGFVKNQAGKIFNDLMKEQMKKGDGGKNTGSGAGSSQPFADTNQKSQFMNGSNNGKN